MKIWQGYSSEHSSRIVLVGHFQSPADAEAFNEEYKKIQALAVAHFGEIESDDDKFPDEIFKILYNEKIKFSQITTPKDLAEFAGEGDTSVSGNDFILTSSEYEWGGTIKMLLMAGAKIELFSRHDYEEEYNKYTAQ